MNFIEKFKFLCEVITNPFWWRMNCNFNKDIDEWLKNAMKHYEIMEIYKCHELHEISIDGKYLWVANHPYASFTYMIFEKYGTYAKNIVFTENGKRFGRPSRYTIYQFNKKLEKFIEDNGLTRA